MPWIPEDMTERPGQSFATGYEFRSFTQSMGDAFRRSVAAGRDNPGGYDTDIYASGPLAEVNAAQARLLAASARASVLVDGMGGFGAAVEQAFDHRIETVRRLTGVTLENPERNAYFKEAEDEYRRLRDQGAISLVDVQNGANFASRRVAMQRDIFNRKVSELAESFPEKAAGLSFGQSVEDQAVAIGRAAREELEAARRDAGGLGGFMAEIGGSFAGMVRDPFNLAVTVLGGGPGTASRLAARVGQVALREGVLNAAVEAVQQPAVQSWRERIGAESGFVPAMENIGLAFAFGAGIGGGLQGLREAFGRGARGAGEADIDAMMKVLTGDARVADVERAAKVLGLPLDDQARADLSVLRRIERDEVDTAMRAPDGVSAMDHNLVVGDAVHFAEDWTAPPPSPPLPARLLDDADLQARRPELFDGGEVSQTQLGLAALSDRAYAMVRAGEVDPQYAAWVGRMAPAAPESHGGLVRALVEAAPGSEAEARMVIRDALAAQDKGVARTILLGAEPPVPEPKPRAPIEPGGPDAARQADALLPAAETPPDARLAPAELSDLIPMATREDGRDMRAMSVMDALRDGERADWLGDAVQACKH